MSCCCCFDARTVLVRGKRRLRSLFWKVRADIKRQMKTGCYRNTKNFNFHYDPFSYSLNFDNGNFGFFC
ncbi:hypothetical protein K1719_032991 [Acacia pycnantha]|nr:hypothetical protein K1719_032991 [Acacia pycnantha]